MRGGLAVAMLLSILAGRGFAQPADPCADADRRFDEGRALMRAARWDEASRVFEEILRCEPALGAHLNLAQCAEHLGELARAWELYQDSIDIATMVDDAERRAYAKEHAARLEPRLPRLAIVVASRSPGGVAVTLDGTSSELSAPGRLRYVNPGRHVVTISAPGFVPFQQTVLLAEGATETIVVPELRPQPPPVPIAPAKVAPRWDTRGYLAIVGGAMGVVTAGAGLWFGAKASAALGDAKSRCGDQLVCDSNNYEAAKRLVNDAYSNATISTVLVITGGAALVASVVVFVTARNAPERATARLVPLVDDGKAGVALAGRF
jgi:hypothetical protein